MSRAARFAGTSRRGARLSILYCGGPLEAISPPHRTAARYARSAMLAASGIHAAGRAGKVMQITVYGLPAPQGSKSFKGMRGGHAILAESSKKVKPWREAVKCGVIDYYRSALMRTPSAPIIPGPVTISLTFTLPKPKSAPKGRRTWPDRKPDIDKLCRSTLDALVDAGAMEDDARVVSLTASKVFPGEGEGSLGLPGCLIRITSAEATA